MTSPPPGFDQGMRAIHAILLLNGKAPCIDLESATPSSPDIVLFNPADGSVELVHGGILGLGNHSLFCCGHVGLPDGRVLFSGGAGFCGTAKTSVYHPLVLPVQAFTRGPEERWPLTPGGPNTETWRYYPTVTALGNGRTLVTDGWIEGTGTCPGNGEIPVILKTDNPDIDTWTWNPLYGNEYDEVPGVAPYEFDIDY
jgi:hypothetical protein